MAAGRALAHQFPTAAKKAPQCGAENRAAIQLHPPAPRAPRPPRPSSSALLSSDSACRVSGLLPRLLLSLIPFLPACVCVSLPVSSLLPFLSVHSEALPVSLFPISLPWPGFNLPAHLWVHLGAQHSSGPSFSLSWGLQRPGSLNVRKPGCFGSKPCLLQFGGSSGFSGGGSSEIVLALGRCGVSPTAGCEHRPEWTQDTQHMFCRGQSRKGGSSEAVSALWATTSPSRVSKGESWVWVVFDAGLVGCSSRIH